MTRNFEPNGMAQSPKPDEALLSEAQHGRIGESESAAERMSIDAPAGKARHARIDAPVSRRAFLGALGVGAAALFIDRVSGGALIATAAELANAVASAVDPARIQFVTIAYDQVAVTIREASDSRVPVAGATVCITSVSSTTKGKFVTGTTDAKGVAVFNVKELAGAYALGNYSFVGSVVVGKEGWRDFETGIVEFKGGDAAGFYLQEDDGKPYLRRLTFDGYDIQYEPASFTSTIKNNVNHTLRAYVVCPAQGQLAEIAYWTGEPRSSSYIGTAEVTSQAVPAPEEGKFNGNAKYLACIKEERQFLFPSAGNAYFLGIGKPLHLYVWVDYNDRFRADAKIDIIEGVIDDARTTEESDKSKENTFAIRCNDFEDHYDGLNVTIPEGVPGLGGRTFGMWLPSLPMAMSFSPDGSFYAKGGITIGGEELNFGTGEDTDGTWQKRENKGIRKQYSEFFGDFKKSILEKGKALDKINFADGKLFSATPAKTSVSWKIVARAMILREVSNDGKTGTFSAGLEACLSTSIEYSQFMVLGVVPISIGISFSTESAIRLLANFATSVDPTEYNPNRLKLHGTSVIIPVKLYLTLSVALDLLLASAGVRGSGWLYITFTLTGDVDGGGGVHALIEAGIDAKVFVEFTVFHYEYVLAKLETSVEGDLAGDTGIQALALDSPAAIMATMSLDEMDGLFQPFDEEALSQTVEGVITLSTMEDTPMLLSNEEPTPNVVVINEDGTEELVSGGTGDAYQMTFEYAPVVDGAGAQDPSSAVALFAANDGPYKPNVEVRLFAGTYANSQLKVRCDSGGWAQGILRIIYTHIRPDNVLHIPGVYFEPLDAPRLAFTAFNSNLSLDQTTIVHNGFTPFAEALPLPKRADYAFEIEPLEQCGLAYSIVGLIYSPEKRDKPSDMMCDNRLTVLLLGSQNQITLGEMLFKTASTWSGYPYAYITQCAFVELGSNKVGFAYVRILAKDKSETAQCVAFLHTGIFTVNSADTSPTLAWKQLRMVEIWSNSGSSVISPFSVDSLVLFKSNSKARNYSTTDTGFDVAYTLTCRDEYTNETRRRIYINTAASSKQAVDPFPDVDYNFKGTLKRWRSSTASVPEGVIAQYEGDVSELAGGNATQNGKLLSLKVKRYVTYSPSYEPLAIEATNIGPTDRSFQVSSFDLSKDGNLLFFSKVFDTDTPGGVDLDGKPVASTTTKRYQICAARFINGRFTDPFPIVDLDRLPDGFQYLPVTSSPYAPNGGYHFTYNHVTDISGGVADTMLAVMPHLKRVTLRHVDVVNSAVATGGTLKLLVTVENEGNVILTAFNLRIEGTGGSPFSQTFSVSCAADNYVPNIYDVRDENNNIVADNAGRGGVFFPGHTNTYNLSVKLPDTWKAGDHELSATVLDDGYAVSTALEWEEDAEVAAMAESYADPTPYVFSVASAGTYDTSEADPAEGEAADAHASNYVEGA